jgi:hypothetical protein
MEVELAIPSREFGFPYVEAELQVPIRVGRGWTALSAGAVLATSTFRKKE